MAAPMTPEDVEHPSTDAATGSCRACPLCDYDVSGTSSPTCPECGANVAKEFRERGAPKPIGPILASLLLGVVGWGYASLAIMRLDMFYTGSPFIFDPLALVLHIMTLATAGAGIASLVWHGRLRRARSRTYNVIATCAFVQFGIIASVWLVISVMM